MNEEARAMWHRGAELEAFTTKQLADMLTAQGWEIAGRKNKLAYKNAILHLEKHPVAKSIVDDLKLVRLEPVG